MNAAFLLVTSAWLAGQAPPPPPAKPMPHPVYAAPGAAASSACCDTGGDSCCEGGFFARLRALCHRHDDCGDTCNTGCGHAAAPATSACGCENECGGGGLLARLRACFHRGGDCCETAATDCCGTAGVSHAAPLPTRPPEPIKAPKEMPKGTTSGAGVIGPPSVVAPVSTLILER